MPTAARSTCETAQDRRTPSIRTLRLVLRPPSSGDVDAIVEGVGNPRVSRMLARVPHPYTSQDAEEFIALACVQNIAGHHLHLMIEHKGVVAGGIGLHGLNPPFDFGYWLAQPYWGNGFATEAAAALLALAFDTLGVERVPSGVFHDNAASLHVQEKLGFEPVGLRKVFSLARGCEVDHIDTILRRERFLRIAT